MDELKKNIESDSVNLKNGDMGRETKDKINSKQTFLIGLGFMSAMIAWMMYNYQMPIILAGRLSDDGITFLRVGLLGTNPSRQFWAGVIMTLDNILAILLQPWFGKLSDRMESKYGRRTPFMIIGVPIAATCLVLMPFTDFISIYVILFTTFIGTVSVFNLAMAFYRAPIVALMPDMTPSKHRSTGNAIINLMGGIGTGLGFMVPIIAASLPFVKNSTVTTDGLSIESYTLDELLTIQNYFMEDFVTFTFTAVLMVISLILFLIFVKEVPTGEKFWHLADEAIEFDPETLQIIPKSQDNIKTKEELKGQNSITKDLVEVFREKEKSGVFILLAIFSWFFGFNALEANFSRWTAEFLLLEGGLVGQLFLFLPAALFIVGIPAAKIAEKLGRRNTIKMGLLFMIFSLGMMIIVQEVLRAQVVGGGDANIIGLGISIALMGVGWALININSITIVWQLAPKEKIGAYTGLYYFFSQLAAILSPIAMGALLWIGEELFDRVVTWRSLLPFMLISMVFALIFMFRVKRGEVELSEEELKALEEEFGGAD